MSSSLKALIENFYLEYANIPKVIGVSTIVIHKGFYVFAISKEKYWKRIDNSYLIDYTAIGGKVEENENILDALQREAQEEINCKLNVINSTKTFFINLNKKVKTIKISERPKPFLIYKKFYKGLPGKPDAHGKWLLFCIVYFSKLVKKPRPSPEIPALLYLSKYLLKKYHKRVKLKRLIEEGALLVENRKIPKHAFIRPMFTPQIIVNSKLI